MTADRKTLLTLLALDCVATIVVFNIIGELRGVTTHFVVWPLMAPLIALVSAFYLIDGYRSRTDMISLEYTSLHLIAAIAATFALLLITFVFLPEGYELQSSRSVVASSFIALAPLTLSYRRMLYLRAVANRSDRNFIFVGDKGGFESFHEECRRMQMRQPVIYMESIPSPDGPAEADGSPHRAFSKMLAEIQTGHFAVEAIVFRESSSDLPSDITEQLIRIYFQGVPTYTVELFHQIYWRKIPLYRLNPTWLFQEGFKIAREPVFARVKRANDIVLSTLGLVLSAPVIALAGLAIWLGDRGPVFFVQTRVGMNHTSFHAIKLRTMSPGGGDSYTRPGDARITRVGRFLRAGRLDELPQLWNVLRGEMSLIGPRAEWDRLVRDYEKRIPCYYYRHLVKPGITGWAQINFRYGESLEDTVRKLEYDLYYIRHFSFRLDASIVLKTIQVMLFGKGR